MNFEAIKNILFDEAERAGLTEYDVYYTVSTDLSAEALGHELSSFTSGTSGGVGFRCAVNGKVGTASSQSTNEETLRALVARAIANAAVIDTEDAPIFFAGADECAYQSKTVEPPVLPSAALLREGVMQLQEGLYAADRDLTDASSSAVGGYSATRYIANSKGLSLSDSTGSVYAFGEAVIQVGAEAVDGCAFAKGLAENDFEGIAKKATAKARAKLGAATVRTGQYDVIFSAEQVRQLLSAFAGVFNGKNALMGLSLLRGKEGTAVAAECVTLLDDPFYSENPVQARFDGEGVPTFTKKIIDKGVLGTLLYDLTNAKKAGKTTTGNAARGYDTAVSIAPYCLAIEGGKDSPEALRARLGNGIYITELKGLHAGANAVTGDFSVESAGFLVENGQLKGAVRGFTVAGNFFSLLKSVAAVADNVEMGLPARTVMACPDILVTGLSVAGE